MEGVGVVTSVIAILELSAKLASVCLKYSKEVKNAKEDIFRLHSQVVDLANASTSWKQLLDDPKSGARLRASRQLLDAVHDVQSQLQRLDERLRPRASHQAMSRLGVRSLKWPFQSKEAEKVVQDLRQCMHTISLALQVDQTSILLDIDQKMVLDRLTVAEGACYDSHAQEHNPTCLPNTRVDLLRQIADWADNPRAQPMFWLNGMAGTGKSTVSRTIAQAFADKGWLSASFFFKRGEADRGNISKFFTTIAADLLVREPTTAHLIKDVLEADPSIVTKTAREQFEKLFQQPLLSVSTSAGKDKPAVIIVDALDECERDEDVKLLIFLLSRAAREQTKHLKIFLTSRPDLPIRLGFQAIEGLYRDSILHEMPAPVIEHDILAFLEHELARIRSEYNASVPEDRQLGVDVPSRSDIQSLVKMAVPLFIVAATVCRFIADRRCGAPDEQLKEVLNFHGSNQGLQLEQLDATYLPVLNKLVVGLPTRNRDKVLQRFRDIIGPIIILATPLTTAALAEILSIPKNIIDGKLDMLHSVLSIPPSAASPVRLLHLSFRDFLLDPDRREQNSFWIDEKHTHETMAANCLRVLGSLKQNICDIKVPGTPRSSLSSHRISDCLPPEVQYASVYWIYHLQQAGPGLDDWEHIYTFLVRHFLHWIEALSLLGRASESINLIKTLQSILTSQCSAELSDFLDDATRFILANISAIDAFPLQIYSSLLVFAPERSKIRLTFKDEAARWISLQPKVESDWGQCLLTLEGHSKEVSSVAFSHNSTLVASGSRDGSVRIWYADTGECTQVLKGHGDLRVQALAISHDSVLAASILNHVLRWRADTGECTQRLEGHSKEIEAAAFSRDLVFVASALFRENICIWRADTGECTQTLEGHGGSGVQSLAFSHNSALVASCSTDQTVRIWRADTGECIQVLEGHDGRVVSVAFSHDSTLVASASWDKTVRIWRTSTGKCIQTLEGHGDFVTSVVFSHDSTLVASGSLDHTARIWRANTGECMQILHGHIDPVRSVAFSHDSTLIASASDDQTVRIWRNTGKYTETLQGHSNVVISVTLSRDLTLIASSSQDHTVRIWCAKTGECTHILTGHSDAVKSVAFSHDSTLVASASEDETVRIWSNTGECVQILNGHSDWVESVTFSHDSTLLASASRDQTVRIWRNTGECIQMFKANNHHVNLVAFSHDSKLVASASDDDAVRIWKLEGGHSSGTTKPTAFLYDSRLVASGSEDLTIRVWRNTGESLQALEGHSRKVTSVAFSHDSKLVASASNDATVRIWRADTGECIQIIDMGFPCCHLSFEHDMSRLQTDAGMITINGIASNRTSTEAVSSYCSASGCGISQDGRWVTWNGEKLLWLPVEARPSCSAVGVCTVVIGVRTGRVVVLRISPHEVPNMIMGN